MACRLFGAKPLPAPILAYCQLDSWEQISVKFCPGGVELTHWGRVTHICVNNLTIIGSDHALSPDRRQAITWTNAGILFIGPLGTNFSEILIEILIFSFKKMRLKVSSGKWRPFCLGLNVLINYDSNCNQVAGLPMSMTYDTTWIGGDCTMLCTRKPT